MTDPRRVVFAAAFFVLLVSLAWVGGEDGGDSSVTAITVVLVSAWLAASVLAGFVLGAWAILLPFSAVVATVSVGEGLGEFDNELRLVNWVIQPLVTTVLICLGAWVRRRRRRS